MAYLRRLGGLAILSALLFAPSASLHANGWEWHSIPREALIAGLESEAADSRSYAIRALGFRADRKVVPRLIAIATSDDEPTALRMDAVQALALIGDERAAAPLTDLLEGAPAPELRGAAGAALSRVGGERALQALLVAFGAEKSLLARTDLIAALGRFTDARAVSALTRELERGTSANLRRRAAIALGETGQASATPALVKALDRTENRGFVGDLVDALGRTGGGEARQPLSRLVETAEDPLLRVRATIALGSVAEGGASAALVKLLNDTNPAIRYHAIKGLASHADPATRPALEAVYREMEPKDGADARDILYALTMRYEIVRALTEIDPAGSAPILRDGAAPRDFGRDSAAALRLGEGAYELRRAAIWGLGYSDSDESAAYLLDTALSDPDFRIRSVAARSLGVLRRPVAVEPLTQRLGDEMAEVRWQAALVLGRLRDARAVEPLIAALGDRHPEVRRQAALALGYLGARKAEALLGERAQADGDARVRTAAREALGLIRR